MKQLLPALLFLASATPGWSCGACSCMLNADWASQGFAPSTGLRLDLRFDLLDQRQLRSGTDTVESSSRSLPSDREIQERTRNRLTTLGLDSGLTANWGFNLQLPFLQRDHVTYAEGDTEPSTSHSSGLGDLRIMARYTGFSPDHTSGLQFGLKLPTGSTGGSFRSGPQAGNPLDAALQLGTGSTDLLLGAHRFGPLGPDWGYALQGLYQTPLRHADAFRPGQSLNLSAALRYTGFEGLTPQVQLNVRREGRESGLAGDAANSGALLAYLCPGAEFRLDRRSQLFTFLQCPVYQNVRGWQLEPRIVATLGGRLRF